MCTNQRLITNIYTKKDFYVKCGKCPSCLQEKASHRVRRIKDTKDDAHEVLMIGLTYARHNAPYIDRHEAYEFAHGQKYDLNVYRDCEIRKVRKSSDYLVGYKRTDKKVVLTTIPYISETAFNNTKDLKFEHNKIGVCYYPDLQHFLARLRLNLKRNYNYDKPFKTYSCSEYGAKSQRPHFHILLFCAKGDTEILRSAIIASWPFSDLSKWPRAIEKCYRGSSYVASYVNSGSNFPSFLKKYFKPKHSYSKGFGLANPNFGLCSILSLFERGSLAYGALRDKQGIPEIVNVPLPAYAIHRYFPKFKAYSRISPTSLHAVMRGITNFDYDTTKAILDRQGVNYLYYSIEEFNKFSVMLNNAFERFKADCPTRFNYYELDDYIRLHRQIWSLHASTVLKLHLTNKDVPDNEKYDNLDYIVYKREHGMPLDRFYQTMDIQETNPNKFCSVIVNTNRFSESFRENIKHRKVTNSVLSNLYEEW